MRIGRALTVLVWIAGELLVIFFFAGGLIELCTERGHASGALTQPPDWGQKVCNFLFFLLFAGLAQVATLLASRLIRRVATQEPMTQPPRANSND
jgi:hypothetical protein